MLQSVDLQKKLIKERKKGVQSEDIIEWVHTIFNEIKTTNQSVLGLGISPMAGYKVTPALSVGPRAKLNYTNFRFRPVFGGQTVSEGVIDYGLGAFVRANVYRGFFAQGEVGYENNGQLRFDGDFIEDRISGINAFLGAGYNSSTGGNLAYEVMLAYDLNLIRTNTLDLLNYRVGFTIFY